MHFLVTRPEGDGEPLKSHIEQLGHRVSLAPLISIVINPIAPADIIAASALVATSRNALKALAASRAIGPARSLPLYVVGPGTAAKARELGFSEIREGKGNAAGLVPLITAATSTEKKSIVHLTGDVSAFDLARQLALCGIELSVITAYRSIAAQSLPPEVSRSLVANDIDAVILMSPRTAKIWHELAERLAGRTRLSAIAHLCLSEAVAARVREGKVPRVLVADRPHMEEMLALVKRLTANSTSE